MNFIKNLTIKKVVSVILQILLLIAVYLGAKAYTQRDLVQNTPPTLNARLLSGVKFNLATHTNKPLLLHFWATWCPVCKLEESSIESISKKYAVVTIAMQSGDKDTLKKYMQSEDLSFPVIADDNSTLANRFGVKAVPISFILNTKGKIVFIEAGYTSSWGLRFRLWLAQFF